MIPKTIHYCWFGGNKMPKELKKYTQTWIKKCPDYKIICWDESNFDINCNSFVKTAYENKLWAFVSDYARLKVIYENGGVYLDTDVELIKNLDFLLKYNFFAGVQQTLENQKSYVATGLGFGAEQKNEIIRDLLNDYDQIFNVDLDKKENYACPILNDHIFKEYGFNGKDETQNLQNNAKIFSSKYFDPLSKNNFLCENTVSVHHYSSSWMDKSTIIRRRIYNAIGLKKINKIKQIKNKIIHK